MNIANAFYGVCYSFKHVDTVWKDNLGRQAADVLLKTLKRPGFSFRTVEKKATSYNYVDFLSTDNKNRNKKAKKRNYVRLLCLSLCFYFTKHDINSEIYSLNKFRPFVMFQKDDVK